MFVLQWRFTSEEKLKLSCADRGAAQLGCRSNVYNIFKRQGIDTVLLQRISDVLKRNFFALYCPEEGAGAENNSTDS